MIRLNRFTIRLLLIIATVAGAAGFSVAAVFVSPVRAWEAFLTNLLFWTGLAQGAVIVSAALYMCQARWGGAGLYRLAEAPAGFLPLGFLLFWALFAGKYTLFPWITSPIPWKSPYLGIFFLFARDGACFFLMWVLSWIFIWASRRREAVDWAEDYETVEEAPAPVAYLAPALAIAYAVTYSVLAIDLVMSLSPEWYSTMFGAYFTFGSFLSGIMFVALFAAAGKRPYRHDVAAERGGVLRDLGTLVFAGSSFWAYLIFSLYLVIWYGDIPKETFFVAPRINYAPWGYLGWTAFGLIWALPFLVLLFKKAKRKPAVLGLVCALGLLGFWIERYVLVSPSITRYRIPFGWIEIVTTIGFLGAFGLSTMPGLARAPNAALDRAPREAA